MSSVSSETSTLRDLETEAAVLSAVLLDNDVLLEVSISMRVDDFSRQAHQEIFHSSVRPSHIVLPVIPA